MERFMGRLTVAVALVAILALGLLPSTEVQSSADPMESSMSGDEVATLSSLRRVSDHPLYTMTYHGDYGPLDAVGQDATDLPTWACALAVAEGPEGPLFGRNFDWPHHPALILFTDAPDAYATVTMVDLGYLVSPEDGERLTELPLESRRMLLAAPQWPFDGMNERGLVVGMAAVQDTTMPRTPNLRTVYSLQVIRELLDHTGTVEEALDRLRTFNIDMTGGPTLHYMISDSSGDAALVEFWDGEMRVIRGTPGEPLVATNYVVSQVPYEQREGVCARYDLISEGLATPSAGPDRGAMMRALSGAQQVGVQNPDFGTQWSIVYQSQSVSMDLVMGRAYDHVLSFSLEGQGAE